MADATGSISPNSRGASTSPFTVRTPQGCGTEAIERLRWRAMACNARRQRWLSREGRSFGICKLQNPLATGAFEFLPLRHPPLLAFDSRELRRDGVADR